MRGDSVLAALGEPAGPGCVGCAEGFRAAGRQGRALV